MFREGSQEEKFRIKEMLLIALVSHQEKPIKHRSTTWLNNHAPSLTLILKSLCIWFPEITFKSSVMDS